MSQSEKLLSILDKVKNMAQSKASMRASADITPQDTSSSGEIDPAILLVRGCRDDILSGKFDPKNHPLWEMKMIN